MSDKCPKCGKRNVIDQRAVLNAEIYGGSAYKLLCLKCKAPIHVYLDRHVTVHDVSIGKFKPSETDFGY